VDPKTDTIYTTAMTGMSVISGRTNTITATLAVPSPATVTVNPKTDIAYLTNSVYTSGGVSVLGPCPK
jgi:DNA-binding beta-propeller fold protein YncE